MKLPSVYESLEYESGQTLRKYRKQLKVINGMTDMLRDMDDETLKQYYHDWMDSIGQFDIKNKKHIATIFALAREVTYRKTGKFQYDVQVLGGLAATERNMIQMSTGSGKTLTLILPVVALGLTHRGVYVLTVNDYLSKRDWEETRPVYDWFELSNAYTAHEDADPSQREAFESDIVYCTNSTLGFAYLNSALASDIGQDIKVIHRPLFAAIIDETDEILMDDARNPLIIANAKDVDGEFATVDYNGESHSVQGIVDKLKTLKNMGYDDEDSGQTFLDERALKEIQETLDVGDELFDNPKLMHIVYSASNAIFQYKAYTDYVVLPEPDPDSGSRIALIDKATGRLSKGRTLSDNMHIFVEMKEGVFAGQSNDSTIQITYQMLFNMFDVIAGVSGTLGTSYKEFIDIYATGVVLIPDRLPNQLKQLTHLYMSPFALYDDLVSKTKFYIGAHHPVLIGATSDIEVDIVSDVLTKGGIQHKTLVSTDKNEDVIVSDAGKPGSVVVTTDIMGRGTDIHVEDVEGERGLVVFQIGARPNSRVERQFAGRAARQGQPGRYHRMLRVHEMAEIGVNGDTMRDILHIARDDRELLQRYHTDLLLNGRSPYYDDIVDVIDHALMGTESQFSTSRVDEFGSYSITDIIQTGVVAQLDSYRRTLKASMELEMHEPFYELMIDLSPAPAKKNAFFSFGKVKNEWRDTRREELNAIPILDLQKRFYQFISRIVSELIPLLRDFSDNAINTTRLAGQVNYDKKPEDMMVGMLQKFMDDNNEYFVFKLPSDETDNDVDE